MISQRALALDGAIATRRSSGGMRVAGRHSEKRRAGNPSWGELPAGQRIKRVVKGPIENMGFPTHLLVCQNSARWLEDRAGIGRPNSDESAVPPSSKVRFAFGARSADDMENNAAHPKGRRLYVVDTSVW
jgi:hypothetical protein